MDTVKQKLLSDLWVVLRELTQAAFGVAAASEAPTRTSDDRPVRAEAGLYYFHLN